MSRLELIRTSFKVSSILIEHPNEKNEHQILKIKEGNTSANHENE